MDELAALAEPFEQARDHLRGVAFRMLGSLSDADDAVQEAWLRLSRADTHGVENLRGWLTTVVARVCLDMLRSRKARREDALETHPAPEPSPSREGPIDPEQEAILADSVGLALLVVLETLAPAERLAFVLHEMFGVPFDEIATIVGRSPAAARQLASRARRRVHGAPSVSATDLARQREVVAAYLAALRSGDIAALVAVLHKDVVIRSDPAGAGPGGPTEVHGAEASAAHVLAISQGARLARPALVNGAAGLVVAPRGKLLRVLSFTVADGKIVQIDVFGDPEHMRQLDLAILDESSGA